MGLWNHSQACNFKLQLNTQVSVFIGAIFARQFSVFKSEQFSLDLVKWTRATTVPPFLDSQRNVPLHQRIWPAICPGCDWVKSPRMWLQPTAKQQVPRAPVLYSQRNVPLHQSVWPVTCPSCDRIKSPQICDKSGVNTVWHDRWSTVLNVDHMLLLLCHE